MQQEQGLYLFCSLLYIKLLEKYLVYSWHSIDTCGVTDLLTDGISAWVGTKYESDTRLAMGLSENKTDMISAFMTHTLLVICILIFSKM